ncbi:MAG TPA: DNA methyltransferase [Candidatus Lokiarchaeia archaeon]|nr:DNA methyltransferase [Candidatus Lokiarchaeia archaeon]
MVDQEQNLVSLDEACQWASEYVIKRITKSNINYLLQYGKINKYLDDSGNIQISLNELKKYYDENVLSKRDAWKKQLGTDLNWQISFENLREKDTTKHVHRLHPYKGKYIPQLVEYFLDSHVDEFKKQVYFKPGDIIIDPFMGSGTTLVQCGELGIHSIGVDISAYNCMIVDAKMAWYDLETIEQHLMAVLDMARDCIARLGSSSILQQIKTNIHNFNKEYFTDSNFKRKLAMNEIQEDESGIAMQELFFKENATCIEQLVQLDASREKEASPTFIDTWFNTRIKQEFQFYLNLISREPDESIKNLLRIIVSRTARACRSTKHFDLATLKQPQLLPYYCFKHKKICMPVESSFPRFRFYMTDSIARIKMYGQLRKDVEFSVINGDSRTVNVVDEIKKQNSRFSAAIQERSIDGLFSSPPYVGQIDYHEQHAYAFEMFAIPRQDDKEIGSLSRGEGMKAKENYIAGISAALRNICQYIKDDGEIFIVANDKYDLYPTIARKSKLRIVNRYKRPVLHRMERDRQPYAEIIFHMKKEQAASPEEEHGSKREKIESKPVSSGKTVQVSLF